VCGWWVVCGVWCVVGVALRARCTLEWYLRVLCTHCGVARCSPATAPRQVHCTVRAEHVRTAHVQCVGLWLGPEGPSHGLDACTAALSTITCCRPWMSTSTRESSSRYTQVGLRPYLVYQWRRRSLPDSALDRDSDQIVVVNLNVIEVKLTSTLDRLHRS